MTFTPQPRSTSDGTPIPLNLDPVAFRRGYDSIMQHGKAFDDPKAVPFVRNSFLHGVQAAQAKKGGKRTARPQESVTPRDIELLHLMLEGDARAQLETTLGAAPTVAEAAAKLTGEQRARLSERFSKRLILHSLRAFLPAEDANLLG